MYRGKTERGVSQEIPKPYLALLLYTHPAPRALDSCQSVGKLSDREHSSLIWMETGTKKGLSAEGRVSCIIIFGLYHLKLLYIKLLTLFIQRKTYFILKEEKESCSLFDL